MLRIRRRHLRADRLAPGVEPRAKVGDPLRLGGGEVGFLRDVGADIVELDAHVVEMLDEFEVARTNRAVGHRPAKLVVLVVRIVPEEIAHRPRAAAQHRREANTVDRRACGTRGQAGHLHQARENIHGDNGRVGGAAGLGHAGPRHNERHAHAALIGGGLAETERDV